MDGSHERGELGVFMGGGPRRESEAMEFGRRGNLVGLALSARLGL